MSDALRVLLLNPPHARRVQRRWVASYYTPNFLLPPPVLLSLGAVAKRALGPGAAVRLTDCIAEGLGPRGLAEEVAAFRPDLVIALVGFSILSADLEALRALRPALPAGCLVGLVGYLPGERPEAVLGTGAADFALHNEPEETVRVLLERLQVEAGRGGRGGRAGRATRRAALTGLAGCHVLDETGAVVRGAPRPRIRDLDALPFPDHGLVDLSLYNESFAPRPIGLVQSARGCPQACSYCVRWYGKKVVYRSPASISAEIAHLRQSYGVRHIRFMDDTFTLNRRRTLALCATLQRDHPWLGFTALTRADRVDPEVCGALARAGCRRLYIGIESSSVALRQHFRKDLDEQTLFAGVRAARAAGIEVSGFFIAGGPGYDRATMEADVRLARALRLDYVIVTRLQYWPGTEEYERADAAGRLGFAPGADGADPVVRHFEDGDFALEQAFYRQFYLDPRYALRRARRMARTPRDSLAGALGLVRFSLARGLRRDFI